MDWIIISSTYIAPCDIRIHIQGIVYRSNGDRMPEDQDIDLKKGEKIRGFQFKLGVVKEL
jgi:hypothetical protein